MENSKTTYSAIAGLVATIGSITGYVISPHSIDIITTLSVAIVGVGVFLVGLFAPDATAVITKDLTLVKNLINDSPLPQEPKNDLDTLLTGLLDAINSQQTKIADAQKSLEQIKQLKVQHEQLIDSIKTQAQGIIESTAQSSK